MNGQERIDERRRRQAGRRGFTLIELLVVMLIILLVSAVVLPTVLPAISHRQVSEAARILQGALAGARDTAINNNAPAGIRLLPDPVLNGQSTPPRHQRAGLDPTEILASNRYIPIQLAPDYAEGFAAIHFLSDGTPPPTLAAFTRSFPYPGSPCPISRTDLSRCDEAANCCTSSSRSTTAATESTCSIRRPPGTGTFGLATRSSSTTPGIWYTVVGPMNIFNPELFVNVGDPGTHACP